MLAPPQDVGLLISARCCILHAWLGISHKQRNKVTVTVPLTCIIQKSNQMRNPHHAMYKIWDGMSWGGKMRMEIGSKRDYTFSLVRTPTL